MNWGKVNPTQAYYNGSRTSKDNEDPSWNTSSRPKELRRQLQLWKRFGRLYLIVFVLVRNIVTLRDELRKLKRKAIVDNTFTTHTIDPEMLKVDVEPIAPRLLNNRTVHSDYLRLTQEQAAILTEVVEQGKSKILLIIP
nr:hypothetical protein [Tanacetum cinerariifolium]